MKCCTQPVPIYIGNKWFCETCGAADKQRNEAIGIPPYSRINPEDLVIDKCECGADSVYGPNNTAHSATMPCPLYRKL